MEFINQNILLIALVVVSGVACSLMPLIMRPSGNSVSPGEPPADQREDAHILDVREVDEYAAGHLPDAVNIQAASWPSGLASWKSSRTNQSSSAASGIARQGLRRALKNRVSPSCTTWLAASMPG
jgi:rhodanese-related sulfurtransferase